ncbi:MAG: hypothetical protein JWP52_552 [Rhizobacter sp.]|nr:hypothetical protein [Rhizobacter sp.]
MNVALKFTAAPLRLRPAPATAGLIGLGVLMALGISQGAVAQESGAAGAVSPSGDTQATSPYYIGASEGLSHESNVFRAPDGPQRSSDNISTTTIFGGFDQPISRQRLSVNGSVRRGMYQDNTDLNNTGYGLNANLAWETINELSGNVSYSINQNLARYGFDSPVANFRGRNIEKSQELQGTARWGGRSLLSLEATGIHRKIDYSAPVYLSQEYSQDVGSLGVKYRPSSLLTVGAGLRLTRTTYPQAAGPNGTFGEDSFDSRNIDLTATYVYSGQSTFDGRLSFGKQDGSATRNAFSGVTGYLGWGYRPTGKLSFNTYFSRDTGVNSAFINFNGNQTAGIGDQSTVTNSYGVSANYLATAKVSVNAAARYTNRDLSNFSSGGSDSTSYLSLGTSYQASRVIQLGCNASYERHSTSNTGSFDYNANVFGCTASITLR